MHWIQNFAIRPDPDPCRILTCRIRPDPNRILVTWIQPDPDPARTGSKPRLLLSTGEKLLFLHHNWKSWNDDLTRIHQIHQISGQIRIWIRCTPNKHTTILLIISQNYIQNQLGKTAESAALPSPSQRCRSNELGHVNETTYHRQ